MRGKRTARCRWSAIRRTTTSLVFGTPSRDTPWGWRVEGHHVSVNFTIAGGRVQDDVIANTPLFFGAEPAEVQGGPLKGLRALGAVEDKARALIDALDPQQQSARHRRRRRLPGDIFNGNNRAPTSVRCSIRWPSRDSPSALRPDGLPSAQMTAYQKQLLKALIDEYLSRMPGRDCRAAFASAGRRIRSRPLRVDRRTRAADAPPSVARVGMRARRQRWVCVPLGFPYYYRVQGPSFLIEYMNTTGNHSHSVWRISRTVTSARTCSVPTTPRCRMRDAPAPAQRSESRAPSHKSHQEF